MTAGTKARMRASHLARLQNPEKRKHMMECLALGTKTEWTADRRAACAKRMSALTARLRKEDPNWADKLRLARSKYIIPAEAYKRAAAKRTGKPCPKSAEGLARIIAAVKAANTGRVHPAEERARRGASNKGKKRSKETCLKISKALKGRKMPPGYSEYARARRAKQVFPLKRSKLEQRVESMLVELGLGFQANRPVGGGAKLWWHQFDFILPTHRVLIEADGCYWHGCKDCGFPVPEKSRDKEIDHLAANAGWHLIRVKEHEVKSDPAAVKSRIAQLIRR